MRIPTSSLFFLCLTFVAFAQKPYTNGKDHITSLELKKNLGDPSLVQGIEFKSVGPTIFGGRIVDIDVSPTDPSHFFVAYASGGLWKTENNGISFIPVFDNEWATPIGDIAVDWKNGSIWVGTGEANSSRSSYAGIGVYKSTDLGKSWMYTGLEESHHISRIVLHPDNPEIAWVAVLGHLYTSNPERGIYKTTDGGKTWQHTLFVNEFTGASDLIVHPGNPNELYAATWEKDRKAWDFTESGPESGIYKSTDGGLTWSLLSSSNSGFPSGAGTGRIGLAISFFDNNTLIYASLDNYNRQDPTPADADVVTNQQLKNITAEAFLKLKKYQVEDYLRSKNFPREITADMVIQKVKNGSVTPADLVAYTEDPNSLLYETDVFGLEVYKSLDGGKSWSKTHEKPIDGVYSSFGYYFGQIKVDPSNPDKIYCLGVPIIKSEDGGKSFTSMNGDNVHADNHCLWINPAKEGHIILGNDGGLNISYDDGENWHRCTSPPVGQFYYLAVDMEKPYNIYGGLQDNGVWYGPSNYLLSTNWQSSGNYPYKRLMGGDGMQVAIDTRDNDIVYTGFQFGNYFRIKKSTNERKRITPNHQLGETPLRWNWQTPIHLSAHNQDILYMGSNKLHRSLNRGENFETISADLTKGGKKGDVPFGTITTIHESPLKFGLIYVGTDDGLLHITKDGGNSWQNITKGLPQDLWVSRIIASQFEKGIVYAALNGYRNDDFTPYLYKSTNYGETWQRIGENLPLEPLNVVKEDPVNEAIIYVGTDLGLYVSLDGGVTFQWMNNGIPVVAVHDVVVHPRENELLVGTHGRSVYLGNVSDLQKLTPNIRAKSLHVFNIQSLRHSSNWGNSYASWAKPNVPEIQIPVYSTELSPATITVLSEKGLELNQFTVDPFKGLKYLKYNLTMDEKMAKELETALNEGKKEDQKPVNIKKADNGAYYLPKGKYSIEVEKSGGKISTTLELKD